MSGRAKTLHRGGSTGYPDDEGTLAPETREERGHILYPDDVLKGMGKIDERVSKKTVLIHKLHLPNTSQDLLEYEIHAGPGPRLSNVDYLLGPTVRNIHWTFRESVDLYLFVAW